MFKIDQKERKTRQKTPKTIKNSQKMKILNLFFFLQIFIEFCDGGALDTIIVDLEKGLTEKQIAYVCRGMCQGLAHLHKQGIIHRDLKAGNVLLTCQVTCHLLFPRFIFLFIRLNWVQSQNPNIANVSMNTKKRLFVSKPIKNCQKMAVKKSTKTNCTNV